MEPIAERIQGRVGVLLPVNHSADYDLPLRLCAFDNQNPGSLIVFWCLFILAGWVSGDKCFVSFQDWRDVV